MPAHLHISTRFGANPFSDRSVICVQQDGSGEGLRVAPLRRTLDALLALPHVHDQGPAEGIERLDEMATPPLLLAALALTLLRKCGVPVERFGVIECVEAPEKGCWFEISKLSRGRAAAQAALDLANGTASDPSGQEQSGLVENAADHVYRAMVQPSAQVFLHAADQRRIPCRLDSGEFSGVNEMGIGVRSRRFRESFFDVESTFAADLAKNKIATTAMLRRAVVSVPRNRLCRDMTEVEWAASEIGYPVVVKPVREGVGRGVTVDTRDRQTLHAAARAASQFQGRIVVEELVPGSLFRLYVANGRALSCILRYPPTVTGDGEHTIAELCEIENRSPDRGKTARLPFDPIDLEALQQKLTTRFGNRGYNVDSVPPAGKSVPLAYNALGKEGAKNVTYTGRPFGCLAIGDSQVAGTLTHCLVQRRRQAWQGQSRSRDGT